MLVTELQRADFSARNVVADLNRLVRFRQGQPPDCSALPETGLVHAMAATAALIKYLQVPIDSTFSTLVRS